MILFVVACVIGNNRPSLIVRSPGHLPRRLHNARAEGELNTFKRPGGYANCRRDFNRNSICRVSRKQFNTHYSSRNMAIPKYRNSIGDETNTVRQDRLDQLARATSVMTKRWSAPVPGDRKHAASRHLPRGAWLDEHEQSREHQAPQTLEHLT